MCKRGTTFRENRNPTPMKSSTCTDEARFTVQVGSLIYAISSAGCQENRQVGQWRTCRNLIEHVGDEPAMVARVVDHVQNDFASAHFTRLPANKGEAHSFVRGSLG